MKKSMFSKEAENNIQTAIDNKYHPNQKTYNSENEKFNFRLIKMFLMRMKIQKLQKRPSNKIKLCKKTDNTNINLNILKGVNQNLELKMCLL